jgi:allantoicase
VTSNPSPTAPSRINVADATLGAFILSVTDEWFAPASSLLSPTSPLFRPGVYGARGKWMDGWETRRHNPQDYDAVVLQLAYPLVDMDEIVLETTHFVGNYAPRVHIDAAYDPRLAEVMRERVLATKASGKKASLEDSGHSNMPYVGQADEHEWNREESLWTRRDVVRQEMGPSCTVVVDKSQLGSLGPVTHLRVKIYPDGGLARIRVYGRIEPISTAT